MSWAPLRNSPGSARAASAAGRCCSRTELTSPTTGWCEEDGPSVLKRQRSVPPRDSSQSRISPNVSPPLMPPPRPCMPPHVFSSSHAFNLLLASRACARRSARWVPRPAPRRSPAPASARSPSSRWSTPSGPRRPSRARWRRAAGACARRWWAGGTRAWSSPRRSARASGTGR